MGGGICSIIVVHTSLLEISINIVEKISVIQTPPVIQTSPVLDATQERYKNGNNVIDKGGVHCARITNA
jgi:hypothetical protein